MSETYTFRYLNADGRLQAMTFIQLDDLHSAKIKAELLMPMTAASVEIWLEDDLISKESNSRPDAPANAS